MPFVHDETEIEWPKDGSDLPPPRPDQFIYLPAPEYRGVREPVGFSILPPAASVEPTESGTPAAPSPTVQPPRRGILDVFRGHVDSATSQQQRRISFDEERRRAKLRREQQTKRLFAIMVPALQSAGVRRAYCRYDGGNDEGWAWLDHYQIKGGDRIELDVLAKQLYEMNVYDQLCASGFDAHLKGTASDQKIFELRGFASGLAHDWAMLLLGESFGTGEYSMYGAFTVDLDACTIIDDPHADPVVENIAIAQ